MLLKNPVRLSFKNHFCNRELHNGTLLNIIHNIMCIIVGDYQIVIRYIILCVVITDNPPFVFYFRVKFYVSEPSKLKEEYTRYISQDFCFIIFIVSIFTSPRDVSRSVSLSLCLSAIFLKNVVRRF